MGHDEVSVMDLHVERYEREPDARDPADREEGDEPEGVEHRRAEPDRAAPNRGEPRPDLDAGRHRDDHRREAEEAAEARVHPGREHVMSPDQEPDQADSRGREHQALVAEQVLAGERGQHLGHNPHSRQHHDVDGRVGIEPEEVLPEDRIATRRRVEVRGAEHAVGEEHRQGAGQDGGRDEDDRSWRGRSSTSSASSYRRRSAQVEDCRKRSRPGSRHAARWSPRIRDPRPPRAVRRSVSGGGWSARRRGAAASRADSMRSPAGIRSQKENAFTRGNAMSRAPVWIGTT